VGLGESTSRRQCGEKGGHGRCGPRGGGKGLVEGAEIIGTHGCLEDLRAAPPSRNALLLRASRVVRALGGAGRLLGRVGDKLGLHTVAWLADAAPFALPLFEHFDFAGNEVVLPTRIFEGSLTLQVGDKTVELIEVGPAHTLGDAVVYVPGDKVLFTGDILFKDAHPVVWQGPVARVG